MIHGVPQYTHSSPAGRDEYASSSTCSSICPDGKLRDAGYREWMSYIRTKLQAFSCSMVAAKHVNTTNKDAPLDRSTLFMALNNVVQRNALLCARLQSPPNSHAPPIWVRLPSVNLEKVVEFLDCGWEELRSVFEDQYSRPFDLDVDLPLWRLAILRDGTVVFIFDPILGSISLHRMLSEALRTQGESTSTRAVEIMVKPDEDSMLPPPLETLIKPSFPTWSSTIRELGRVLNPFRWRRDAATWSGNPIPSTFELDTHVRILPQYTASQIVPLVQIASSRGATLTAVLHTISLLALSRIIHKHGLTNSSRYAGTFIPLGSRRQYTDMDMDRIRISPSFYHSVNKLYPASTSVAPSLRSASGSDFKHLPDSMPAFPWHDAARFARRLKRDASWSATDVGTLKHLMTGGGLEAHLQNRLGAKRSIAIELSDLGASPLDDSYGEGPVAGGRADVEKGLPIGALHAEPSWAIREMAFSLPGGALGSALKIGVTRTPSGGLGIVVAWGKSAVTDAFAMDFVAAFEDGMATLLT